MPNGWGGENHAYAAAQHTGGEAPVAKAWPPTSSPARRRTRRTPSPVPPMGHPAPVNAQVIRRFTRWTVPSQGLPAGEPGRQISGLLCHAVPPAASEGKRTIPWHTTTRIFFTAESPASESKSIRWEWLKGRPLKAGGEWKNDKNQKKVRREGSSCTRMKAPSSSLMGHK